MQRLLASVLAGIGMLVLLPSQAAALTLVTCPPTPAVGDRVFAIDTDSLSIAGLTVTCFDYGDGNNLTGGASDSFLAANPTLDLFDYDNGEGQGDNSYFYTEDGTIDLGLVSPLDGEFVFGTFNFGATYTATNGTLYLGFKVGQNIDPSWAVFALTGWVAGPPDPGALTGTWYIKPPQGSGISHSSIYGSNVPPDVVPDPAVPEPTSLILLGTGLAAAAAASRRRAKKQ